MWLSDAALDRLREAADLPDTSGTRYEVTGTLGRGGMGTVYLARDRELDREVALKVLALPGADPERMLREARILARLEHPGLVPVHDAGVLPDGRAFYAMKRVRGRRLDEVARAAALPERLRIFQRVCEAVAFAHAHGVIHRDLKPENVMVGPFGEVLVLDWGVAKLRSLGVDPASGPAAAEVGEAPPAAGRGTAHGTVLGTPGYMAPEQARGEVERVDERADVWALGAMLGALLAVDGGPPPRPLAAIRDRAQAEEPGERYACVEDLAADLGSYLAGLPVAAYREGLVERLGRVVRRHRTPILLVLAYLLMRVLLLLWNGR